MRAEEDEILGRAAQLSYYFLLALFPLLLFLVTLFGYLDVAGSQLRHKLISYLGSVMPDAALHLVVVTIDQVTNARGGGKLSFGLLAALWAASSGLNALATALNAAYDVVETRPWWKVRLISIALTVVIAVLIVSALLIVLYGGRLGHFLATFVHEGYAFSAAWRILQWPIALVFVFIAFSLIYQFAPDVAAKRRRLPASDYRRRWLSPGVVIAI
ncbi:MAG: YihY/virulence factor BrkB family protein, partial [Terriglobales bacterium]